MIDGSGRTGKNAEKSGYGLSGVACYPRICLQELKKPMKTTVRRPGILANIRIRYLTTRKQQRNLPDRSVRYLCFLISAQQLRYCPSTNFIHQMQNVIGQTLVSPLLLCLSTVSCLRVQPITWPRFGFCVKHAPQLPVCSHEGFPNSNKNYEDMDFCFVTCCKPNFCRQHNIGKWKQQQQL